MSLSVQRCTRVTRTLPWLKSFLHSEAGPMGQVGVFAKVSESARASTGGADYEMRSQREAVDQADD
jgi:hypothetical protein